MNALTLDWESLCFPGKQMRKEGNPGQTGQVWENDPAVDVGRLCAQAQKASCRCLHHRGQPEMWKTRGGGDTVSPERLVVVRL